MVAERAHAVTAESAGSHAVYVSHAKAVSELIGRATREVATQ